MWKVWIFLAPLCPICQDYTFYLNSMYADWEQEYPGQIEMVGWFPNPTVTSAEITEFRERYAVEWELERDTVGWSDGLSAKYTPEVFVLDSTGVVRYQGRINDFYFALGKHRRSPKNEDLRDAVEALVKGGAPVSEYTDAIGCPIENRIPFNKEFGQVVFPEHIKIAE